MVQISFITILLLLTISHTVLGEPVRGLGIKQASRIKSKKPPRKVKPLTNDEINSLPAYKKVKVGTFHFEYNAGGIEEVPQVSAELAAMQFIFGSLYRFEVTDYPIPLSSSADAQATVEEAVRDLYSDLSGPDSLAIIIYGGHGEQNGIWTLQGPNGYIQVDWKSVDTNVIAPIGVDTFQLIDACFAASLLPEKYEANPSTWDSRGKFDVISSASRIVEAGSGNQAFTKAVIWVLAPPRGEPAVAFTPRSLFDAIPIQGVAFATLIGDYGLVDAIISDRFTPEYFEYASAGVETKKIAPLGCGTESSG